MNHARLFLTLILTLGSLTWSANGMTEQTLFQQNTHGYKNIRIPTLCKTTQGTLLAFAEGREAGDAGKIDTIMRRSEDGGKTWGTQQVIWTDASNTCGNPSPVVDRDTGTLWLFNTWNLGSDHEGAIIAGTSQHPRRVFLCKSTDDGKTWSTPVAMPHLRKETWGWYATGPCNGIQLTRGVHRGRLICPANHSDRTIKGNAESYKSHIIYSDDHGTTWHLGAVQDALTNESTVVELSDGSVMQNMRSYHGKHNRAAAISHDGGVTFGTLYLDAALQSPVCQASILRVSWKKASKSKSRILFSSPVGRGRTHMTIRVSYDEGRSWPLSKEVYQGGSAYSNLVKIDGNRVGLFYEKDNYAKMVFVTIPLSKLESDDPL